MFSGLTIHHWITSWDALPWGRLCLSPLLRTFSSLKFFMWGEASCTLPPSILSCHLSLSLFSPCLGSHADQLSFLGDFYGRGKLIFQSSGRRKLWLIISAHAIKVCTETRGRPCHFHGSEALVSWHGYARDNNRYTPSYTQHKITLYMNSTQHLLPSLCSSQDRVLVLRWSPDSW